MRNKRGENERRIGNEAGGRGEKRGVEIGEGSGRESEVELERRCDLKRSM
jgi:hypothetical protein